MNPDHADSRGATAPLSSRAERAAGRREFLAQAGRLSLLAAAACAAGRAPLSAAEPRPQPANVAGLPAMGLALRAYDLTDDSFIYLKQIGVQHVLLVTTDFPSFKQSGALDLDEVVAIRRRIEGHGLRLAAVHLDQRTLSNLLLGLPGADDDLDRMCRLLQVLGKAGVPFLNYSLLVSRAILNRYGKPLPGHQRLPVGRGGAVLLNYDDARALQVAEEPAGRVSADEMWARIERFARRCVPAAHEAGVVLGLHPDDPPVEQFWGVTQVLNSLAGLERFLALAPSPYNGLVLCQGTIQEARIDVLDYIRHFGPQGRIGHVELRGVRGVIPNYTEEFMDGGDLSMLKVLRALKGVGYTGPVEVAHVPMLLHDPKRAVVQAWSVAYLKGLLEAVYETP
ncbi:MAG: mannonate dehydratase [Opitutaceae bacterium]|nr:mannonate dehydratase [Opitutaceae bacterium]